MHSHLAEAAAVVLIEPGLLDGISAPLAANETHHPGDVAEMLSELSDAP